MNMNNRYLVVANTNGKLGVTVNEDLQLRPGVVVLYTANDIDEAFDWKEDMETRIARASGHCATCD
jgi:hypothetical protein